MSGSRRSAARPLGHFLPKLGPCFGTALFSFPVGAPGERAGADKTPDALVLQLWIGAFFVVGHGRTGLVSSPPKRPLEDEGYAGWRFEDELCQEVSDFRNGMNQSGHEFQAAIAGLVLFGLPQASRRKSAANLARNAAAAMTRVIWRCQPCQDRASR